MKTGILFCILMGSSFISAQPLIEENFIYPEGTLTELSSNWIEDPVGTYDVQVVQGNLFYPGYPSSGAGNMIFLDGGASRSGIRRSFIPVSGEGKKVYFSFLLCLQDTLDLSSSAICRLKTQENVAKLYIYLQKAAETGKYRAGLSKTGATFLFDTLLMNTEETYLIVVSYQFDTGYDSMKLWINPDLSGSIPPPNLIFCPNQTDAANITSINFLQTANSGNEFIDGIRVDTTWAQAPLPVILSTFTASSSTNGIELKWRTETEISNYGFEIEKYTDTKEKWYKIGFLNGYGNSNIPREYTYTDKYFYNCSKINYRLKQIDTDGNSTYSKEIVVIPYSPVNFLMYQNYPNPFNSRTNIRYLVPEITGSEGAIITIKTYNVLGNEISTILSETKTPGVYELSFNADDYNLPGGVYFYSFTATSNNNTVFYNAVRKFILLK